jgi:hypothetical protein
MKTSLFLTLITSLTFVTGLAAQETIEIINQNGQRVGNAQIQVQVDNQHGNQDSVAGVAGAGVAGTVDGGSQFKIEGDKIIIVDENGKTQEIDIAGAKSVSVQQSVKTVDKNGQQQTVRHGKAIIITPDGQRQIIELGAPLEGEEVDMPQLDFQFQGFGDMPEGLKMFQGGLPGSIRVSAASLGKYMIGVTCEPVSDELRAHLDLQEGTGLIVQSVSPDSPAAKAGIEQHDILLIAEDKELTTTQDLINVVQTVGAEGKAMNLTAIRAGKEISLSVTPAERPADQLDNVILGGPDVQFQQFGPGIILDGSNPMLDMQQQIEQMRKQMLEMEEMMRQGNFKMPAPKMQPDQGLDQDSDHDND